MPGTHRKDSSKTSTGTAASSSRMELPAATSRWCLAHEISWPTSTAASFPVVEGGSADGLKDNIVEGVRFPTENRCDSVLAEIHDTSSLMAPRSLRESLDVSRLEDSDIQNELDRIELYLQVRPRELDLFDQVVLSKNSLLEERSQRIINGLTCLYTHEKLRVWVNTFIPAAIEAVWAGDSRDFSTDPSASSRTHELIEVDILTRQSELEVRRIGQSHMVVPRVLLGPGPSSWGPYGGYSGGANVEIFSATASSSGLIIEAPVFQGNSILFHFEVDASNPLMPGAPSINLDFKVLAELKEGKVTFAGLHDGFPAYEVYMQLDDEPTQVIYRYDPRSEDEGPRALFPPMDKAASRTVAF
jgi:Protein of unknown function (DUF3238)